MNVVWYGMVPPPRRHRRRSHNNLSSVSLPCATGEESTPHHEKILLFLAAFIFSHRRVGRQKALETAVSSAQECYKINHGKEETRS